MSSRCHSGVATNFPVAPGPCFFMGGGGVQVFVCPFGFCIWHDFSLWGHLGEPGICGGGLLCPSTLPLRSYAPALSYDYPNRSMQTFPVLTILLVLGPRYSINSYVYTNSKIYSLHGSDGLNVIKSSYISFQTYWTRYVQGPNSLSTLNHNRMVMKKLLYEPRWVWLCTLIWCMKVADEGGGAAAPPPLKKLMDYSLFCFVFNSRVLYQNAYKAEIACVVYL